MSFLQTLHLRSQSPSLHLNAQVPAGWEIFSDARLVARITQHIAREGYPATAALLGRQIRQTPPTADVLGMLSLCFLHMGRVERAANAAARAFALAPLDASWPALCALALSDVHQADAGAKARQSLALAYQLEALPQDNFEDASTYMALAVAKLALNAGNYRLARHASDAAVQKSPACALAQSIRAEIVMLLDGADSSMALAQMPKTPNEAPHAAVMLQSPRLQAQSIITQAQRGQGCAQAQAACTQQLETLTRYGAYVPYVVLAAAYMAQMRDGVSAAEQLWHKAPQGVSQHWLPAQLHRIGVFVGQDALKASDLLRTIAPSASKHPSVRAARAAQLDAQQRPEPAALLWARLAAQTDDGVRTDALWAQAGKPQGLKGVSNVQRRVLLQLLTHAPKHAEALYQLANDALVKGQQTDATALALRLLATGDTTGRAHFILGMTRYGPTPWIRFRKYLEAPKRDAALLDEARMYLAHEAFASDLWDEAIAQVRAVGAAEPEASVAQSLAYLEASCQEGLVMTGAEACIKANRALFENAEVPIDALQAALAHLETRLCAVDTLLGHRHLPARLALLGQKAWLQFRLGETQQAAGTLAAAREACDGISDAVWPVEAEQAALGVRAARWALGRLWISYVCDVLKSMCLALGSKALSAGVTYLEGVLTAMLSEAAGQKNRALVF